MNIAEQLQQIETMRASGALSDKEFNAAKERILEGQPVPPVKMKSSVLIHGIEERTWCTLMHVSQLLNYSIVGIVVPVLLWILGKDTSAMVNRHGNRMMNWIISSLIYYAIAFLLCLIAIGIPIVFVLGILGIVFPIIAAVKANSGQAWSYPLSIKFLNED